MWTHNTFIGEDNVHKLYYNAAFMADSFSRSVCHLHHGLESTNLQRNLVSTKKIQNIFIWSPIIKRLINFYKWYLLHSYSISLKLIRFSNEKQAHSLECTTLLFSIENFISFGTKNLFKPIRSTEYSKKQKSYAWKLRHLNERLLTFQYVCHHKFRTKLWKHCTHFAWTLSHSVYMSVILVLMSLLLLLLLSFDFAIQPNWIIAIRIGWEWVTNSFTFNL